MDEKSTGIIERPLAAFNVRARPARLLTLLSGTEVTVGADRIRWLGYEGLYSDITVPELPGYRFRVGCRALDQALNRAGLATTQPSHVGQGVAGDKFGTQSSAWAGKYR